MTPKARIARLCGLLGVVAAAPTPLVPSRCAPDEPIASVRARWLADGRIVMLRNGGSSSDGKPQLFIMNADGSGAIPLLDSASDVVGVIPSPDGSRIAFRQAFDEDTEVFVLQLDRRRVTHIGAGHWVSWSPDSRQLAFVRRDIVAGVTDTFVYVGDAEGSRTTRVARGADYTWAPDGRRLAVVSGDEFVDTISIVHASGGAARALTVGVGLDHWLQWSPDGRSIAYVRGRVDPLGQRDAAVSVIDVRTARERVLVSAGAWSAPLAWSPDGRRLAVTARHGDRDFAYVVGIEERRMVRVDSSPGNIEAVVWSLDGRRLAVQAADVNGESLRIAAADGSGAREVAQLCGADEPVDWSADSRTLLFGGSCDGGHEVYLADADAGSVARLTWGAWINTEPAWSPDGRRIAFARLENGTDAFVYIAERDGSGERRVASGREPAWSPDGARIAFSSKGATGTAIQIADADGRDVRALITAPWWATDSADARAPKWSPDGARIVFEGKPKGGRTGIYVVPIATGIPFRMSPTESEESSPAWSPDRRRIVFSRHRESGESNGVERSALFVMDTNGGHRTQVTSGDAFDVLPAWSADGRYIAFTRYDGASLDVYAMNADGSELRRVTDHPAFDWGASWSPDGQAIAFASDRGGNANIWATKPDGTGLRQLTRAPGAARAPAAVYPSLNGAMPRRAALGPSTSGGPSRDGGKSSHAGAASFGGHSAASTNIVRIRPAGRP